MGARYNLYMRVYGKSILEEYIKRHRDIEGLLNGWHDEVKRSTLTNPLDVSNHFSNAKSIKNDRVVFNLHGNEYRLVVRIDYKLGAVEVRFIGTHQEYNKIDATTI